MNVDDLRAQLRTQATGIDPATPVPLPTIHRRAKTLKRHRTAAVLTSAAVAVAVAFVVLPGTINHSAPDPAEPPPNYTQDGVTIPGTVGADHLEKAEIGKPGATFLEFTWTPTTTDITIYTYCRTTTKKMRTVQVHVNGRLATSQICDDAAGSPRHERSVPGSHVFWPDVPLGKAARVQVVLTDLRDQEITTTEAQLAIGIYRSSSATGRPR